MPYLSFDRKQDGLLFLSLQIRADLQIQSAILVPGVLLGGTVIKSEALAEFAKSIQGNRRVSVPVNAALLSTGVAEGIVEPQRLPGIDVMPKQRLFTVSTSTGAKDPANDAVKIQVLLNLHPWKESLGPHSADPRRVPNGPLGDEFARPQHLRQCYATDFWRSGSCNR